LANNPSYTITQLAALIHKLPGPVPIKYCFGRLSLDYWNRRCPLTGIDDEPLLRASHIVAWADCETDAMRLDVHNGLLLSALWDCAFDMGLVSFADGTPVQKSNSWGASPLIPIVRSGI
jgi:hypothetical protein